MWKSVIAILMLSLTGCDRSQSPSTHVALGPEDFAAPEGAPAPTLSEQPASAANEAPREPPSKEADRTVYVCPMHPEVVSEQPGSCPKCHMTLEPKPAPKGQEHAPQEHATHDHAAHDHAAGAR